MKKDDTILLLVAVAAIGYFLYKSGFLTNAGTAVGDKYTQYANAMQGLATNATGNFLATHNGISQGINDQINTSVNTGINAITGWVQQAADNKNRADQREFDQYQQYINSMRY